MTREQYKIVNGCEANCRNCKYHSGGYRLHQYISCDYCDEAFDPDCNDACDRYEDDEIFDEDEE